MNKDKINREFLELPIDYLYHLGIDTTMDLVSLFGGVKFAIFTRSHEDAAIITRNFVREVYNIEESNINLTPLYKTERFHFYKIKNTIIVSAGIGSPSTLICLNEVTKLLLHAKSDNPIFIHIGPAGGISCPLGTLLINDKALNPQFQPIFNSIECGIEYNIPTNFNHEITDDLYQYAVSSTTYDIKLGSVIGATDYYDEQARTDGFLQPDYSVSQRNDYLQHAKALGIDGINMEILAFAGFCNQLDIKACGISILVNDRLVSDRVLVDKSTQTLWLSNAAILCAQYIKRFLENA